MTEAGKEIIMMFKKKGKFTTAGNREYWEELYFEQGKIICAGGGTNGGYEEYRDEISEEQALNKLKTYFKYKALVFDRDKRVESDEEVLNYWKDNPYA